MAVAMKQKELRSDSWNPRAFTPGRMSTVLDQISLVARNYGDGIVSEEVLLDWFDFLASRREAPRSIRIG